MQHWLIRLAVFNKKKIRGANFVSEGAKRPQAPLGLAHARDRTAVRGSGSGKLFRLADRVCNAAPIIARR